MHDTWNVKNVNLSYIYCVQYWLSRYISPRWRLLRLMTDSFSKEETRSISCFLFISDIVSIVGCPLVSGNNIDKMADLKHINPIIPKGSIGWTLI